MNIKGRILVADDEASLRMLLGKELTRAGYAVEAVDNGDDALSRIREDFFHVVLLDIVMPKTDGLEVLRRIKKERIGSEVIVLTGNATLENCVECMKNGAFEYVRKPYALSELCIQIERAIEHQRSKLDVQLLQGELRKAGRADTILGTSRTMQGLRTIIGRVAPSNSTVLVLGESGTGKELVARSIHEVSKRRDRPFIAVNCASFSETLLESELFGHEKGAFTDAKTQKLGLAEIADGGTLFLDEVGEIPLHFQAKLLRFLETGDIRRVGGTRGISLDVRIICATNQPLEMHVQQKRFRNDLFYRLNVLTVTVPPLREHIEDIPLLVNYFITMQGFNKEFDSGAIDLLMSYEWPGNVRELRNVVERTSILTPGRIVTAADLAVLGLTSKKIPAADTGDAADSCGGRPVSLSISDMERRHILHVLKVVKGHKGKAARLLEINPKTLYLKMKSYHIVSVYE
ncbi:MAG: sigma-54-dependent Fis family transcriptional regulator [Chitinispirillaceae bacterium]|nr:sigma-54-dependent Fis family transcriptional regulator [Chitinispirillaceae bacterium]